MIVLIIKNKASNTMYIVQELHIFWNHSKSHYKLFYFHQYFHYILQLIDELFFSTLTIFII